MTTRKRMMSSEGSPIRVIKRQFLGEIFKAKGLKRQFSSERLQTKDPKRKFPNGWSQAKVRKQRIPSQRSQTEHLTNIATKIDKSICVDLLKLVKQELAFKNAATTLQNPNPIRYMLHNTCLGGGIGVLGFGRHLGIWTSVSPLREGRRFAAAAGDVGTAGGLWICVFGGSQWH